MHALRDGLQTLRPMEHRIHGGNDGGQNLRRADIGGRAPAADMLFARLKSETIGAVAARVDRHAAASAPISPGGFRSVSASGSAATTAIAFASCNLAIVSEKSWKSPVTPGY